MALRVWWPAVIAGDAGPPRLIRLGRYVLVGGIPAWTATDRPGSPPQRRKRWSRERQTAQASADLLLATRLCPRPAILGRFVACTPGAPSCRRNRPCALAESAGASRHPAVRGSMPPAGSAGVPTVTTRVARRRGGPFPGRTGGGAGGGRGRLGCTGACTTGEGGPWARLACRGGLPAVVAAASGGIKADNSVLPAVFQVVGADRGAKPAGFGGRRKVRRLPPVRQVRARRDRPTPPGGGKRSSRWLRWVGREFCAESPPRRGGPVAG